MGASRKGTRCCVCGLAKTPLVYMSAIRPFCTSCYVADKKTKKSLIKKLPSVPDIAAPLGYHCFELNYFSNELSGKQFADMVFKMPTYGAVN